MVLLGASDGHKELYPMIDYYPHETYSHVKKKITLCKKVAVPTRSPYFLCSYSFLKSSRSNM